MSGLFKSEPFVDPQLGELKRSRGAWRGTLALEGEAPVPLVISGGRAGPDEEALAIAKSVAPDHVSWRPAIERELYEHYEPYAEAAPTEMPAINEPSAVWPHTTVDFVRVTPLSGVMTIELGYRVAWDEEHTLAARLRDGELLELCGSVLGP